MRWWSLTNCTKSYTKFDMFCLMALQQNSGSSSLQHPVVRVGLKVVPIDAEFEGTQRLRLNLDNGSTFCILIQDINLSVLNLSGLAFVL